MGVGLEGCASMAECPAFYPAGSVVSLVCPQLVSRTWTVTRAVTAPPGSSQQVFFQFLLTFFPGSVRFVFLLAMAIDEGL